MSLSQSEVVRVYQAIDTMSGAKFSEFFTPQGIFVFGNGPTVTGREAIATYVDQFFGMIAGIAHEVEDIWSVGNAVISRFKVTYRRKQGDTMSFPGVNVWIMDGAKIADYRIYLDNSPLWS